MERTNAIIGLCKIKDAKPLVMDNCTSVLLQIFTLPIVHLHFSYKLYHIIPCLLKLLMLTMVSLITDADHSTCTVAVAAAESRAGLSNVNMVHSPAVPLSCALFLDPAELSSPGNVQQKI